MGTLLEPEVFEELEMTLNEIKELSADGIPIIVEGMKDEKSLRKLGVTGPVYQIPDGGKTTLNSLEDIRKHNEVIVLTDFDRTGEDLADFCEEHLEKLGVVVLHDLREKLRSFVRKAVKDVEGMASFVRSERAAQRKHSFEYKFSEFR
ncbi:hypothetical protein AKJ38_00785 [candidate division MSBL1 archaeon SCGC-AAA259I14]|uniref:Toprim domain-containing protein n=1 Tax=candidate division MSBL1 archaeon SCGC-AAA259I14 TaxID=1698268 RepID=A0A133UTR2_9EURY|nr:hypothetical protein AKJ38_00785 [candidate division MSBL1 archaeon SCGC-AAA259I14]